MKLTTKIATGALAGALCLGIASPAGAQEPGGPTGPGAGEESGAPGGGGGQGGRGAHRFEFARDLAEELGISVQELRTATEEIRDECPAEPFADNLEAREWRQSQLAEALGISLDEVTEAASNVFTEDLAEAVEAGRITQEEADEMVAAYETGTLEDLLHERRIERLSERLATAVENGDLTQEEADQKLAEAEQRHADRQAQPQPVRCFGEASTD